MAVCPAPYFHPSQWVHHMLFPVHFVFRRGEILRICKLRVIAEYLLEREAEQAQDDSQTGMCFMYEPAPGTAGPSLPVTGPRAGTYRTINRLWHLVEHRHGPYQPPKGMRYKEWPPRIPLIGRGWGTPEWKERRRKLLERAEDEYKVTELRVLQEHRIPLEQQQVIMQLSTTGVERDGHFSGALKWAGRRLSGQHVPKSARERSNRCP